MSSNVRSRLKFGKISRKRPIVYENVKRGCQEFDYIDTLKSSDIERKVLHAARTLSLNHTEVRIVFAQNRNMF